MPRTLLREVKLYSFFIEFIRLTLIDGDCILGALTKTCSEAITQIFTQQLRLTIDHLKGAFRAGWNADPAPVTFFLVDMDDLP